MVEEKLITRSQADRAYSETLSLQPPRQGIVAAPHFLFWAASQLTSDAGTDILTSLDLPLQTFVDAQVRQVVRALRDRNVHQAAAIVIDNSTGDVLAYVGSPNYFSGQDASQFDGVQALRQPGSTLKPFLYQLALSTDTLQPNTVLPDIPTYYALSDARIYKPVDFDRTFQGPVRVRLALANSLNIPAIKVLEDVGTAPFLDHLKALGFAQLDRPPDYYGLGLALGGGEVSLWELARAYATFSQLGDPVGLRTLAKDSQAFSTSSSLTATVGDRDTWAVLADMLSDRHARANAFGVESVLNLPFQAAVKTGTSSGFRDTWTVGFTTDYTVATWVGNFDGSSMQEVSGVDGAAPLWQRILLHLHETQTPRPFPTPLEMVRKPICTLSGLKPTDACPAVTQEFFEIDDLAAYENHPDTFYQFAVGGEVELNLPPEYDEWLALHGDRLLSHNTLKILSPRDGDRFIIYPDSPLAPAGSQQIEFRRSEFAGDITWSLNNRPIDVPTGRSIFLDIASWGVDPGSQPCRSQRSRYVCG